MVDKKLHIHIEKNDRNYTFIMDNDTPIGEAYDAAFEVLQRVMSIAKKATDNVAPKKPQGEDNG